VTASESPQQQNGDQLQNGAPSGVEGEVAQLINFEDDDGYNVEVRQQTEQTSHTAELVHQQPDGSEEVLLCSTSALKAEFSIFGSGRPVPKRYSSCSVLVISSLKIPNAFLIRSGAQRNFAYAFVLTFPTDPPSQIFHLVSN